MKRLAHSERPSTSIQDTPPLKKRKGAIVVNDFTKLQQGTLTSGRFYFTKVRDIPECFNEGCYSLSQLLAEIKPELSIHFNFMIEIGWVLDQYPLANRNTPISLVVGEKMGTEERSLRRDVEDIGMKDTVQVAGAHLPIMFGTHHTKLSLFESNSRLHIVVSTANLVEGDWGGKTQSFYYCCALLDQPAEGESEVKSPFKEDLVNYLKRYNLPLVEYWIDRLQTADFCGNIDRFIFSAPGTYKGQEKQQVAHLSLRNALSKQKSLFTKEEGSPLYVAQCSSIGSLGPTPERWMFSQFLNSLRGGITSGSSRLFLIYPTVSDVRSSVEGYNAGGSLPYQSSTEGKQQWLRSYMCRWRSETRGRSRAMPHVKSYAEFGVDRKVKWILITSANLSKAAWGELQKNGEQLMVRSWEAGVLVQDPSRIELPFDYPIARYKEGDVPWVVDKNYEEEDRYGKQWIYNRE